MSDDVSIMIAHNKKTHYSELLDEYDRNDIKKSDAYQSGFLEGTTPRYEAYMQLRKNIAAQIN